MQPKPCVWPSVFRHTQQTSVRVRVCVGCTPNAHLCLPDCRLLLQTARRFVISYYLCDDTLSVFEVSDGSVGMQQGKFLDRGHYRKAHAHAESASSAHVPKHSVLRRIWQGDRFGYSQVCVLQQRSQLSCMGPRKHTWHPSNGLLGCASGAAISEHLLRFFFW